MTCERGSNPLMLAPAGARIAAPSRNPRMSSGRTARTSLPYPAEALQVSPDTVMRDWKVAKVWLARELAKGRRHG
jgi:hypothetical protein